MIFIHRYEQAIDWIVRHCPGPDKFVHTYAGLGIWLLAALVSRRPLHSPWTLVPLVALELANETIDRLAHGSWHWPDTLGDVAATWFWPFVLCACLRLFPSLSGRRPKGSAPLLQHDVDSPGAAVPPVRAPDRDDVSGVFARREPV